MPTADNIAITGATGLVGTRLIEVLYQRAARNTVAFVHSAKNGSRISRYNLPWILGDITNPHDLAKIPDSCRAIIHTAVSFTGNRRKDRETIIRGTREVCKCALNKRARLIYFSTYSVYGGTGVQQINNTTRPSPDTTYGSNKLKAEKIVRSYTRKGLEAVILRPVNIYGPWSFWTQHAASVSRNDAIHLPNHGNNLCPLVYIDDVVEACLLAINHPAPGTGPFVICSSTEQTWADFYLSHVTGPHTPSIEDLSPAKLSSIQRKNSKLTLHYWLPLEARTRFQHAFRALPWLNDLYSASGTARRIHQLIKTRTQDNPDRQQTPLQTPATTYLPAPDHLTMTCSSPSTDHQHAADHLGYSPTYDLAAGSRLAREWLQWANI